MAVHVQNHTFIVSQEPCDHLCLDGRDLVAELRTEVVTEDMGGETGNWFLTPILLGIRIIAGSYV